MSDRQTKELPAADYGLRLFPDTVGRRAAGKPRSVTRPDMHEVAHGDRVRCAEQGARRRDAAENPARVAKRIDTLKAVPNY